MPEIHEIARTEEEVISVTADATVAAATTVMKDENVGSVLVTEDEDLVGILTDRDVAVRVTAEGRAPGETLVRDVMTEEMVTATVDDEISDVIEAMGDEEVRRIPVIDGGEVAGIVALDDIVVLLAVEHQSISAELQSISNVIRSESPPYLDI